MSPTIQARAEAAAKEVTDDFIVAICAEFDLKPPAPEYRLKCEGCVSILIARHFSDLEALRAAAERVEKAIRDELEHTRAYIVELTSEASSGHAPEFQALIHVDNATDALNNLCAALTPDAAADGTKKETL